MLEKENPLIAIGTTLIAGLLLLIVSEIFKIIVIKPIQNTRQQIQIALSAVDFHCNMLTNYFPKNLSNDNLKQIACIKNELRRTATDLKASYNLIPIRKALSKLKFIPSQLQINIAFQGLMYLHNSILIEGKRPFVVNEIEMNHNWIERIQAALTNGQIPEIIHPKES